MKLFIGNYTPLCVESFHLVWVYLRTFQNLICAKVCGKKIKSVTNSKVLFIHALKNLKKKIKPDFFKVQILNKLKLELGNLEMKMTRISLNSSVSI